MAFQEKLRESPEYKKAAGKTEVQQQHTGTAEDPMGPVLQFEKGDVEFWMQVAMVVLLFLIYRELARANGRVALQGIARGASA